MTQTKQDKFMAGCKGNHAIFKTVWPFRQVVTMVMYYMYPESHSHHRYMTSPKRFLTSMINWFKIKPMLMKNFISHTTCRGLVSEFPPKKLLTTFPMGKQTIESTKSQLQNLSLVFQAIRHDFFCIPYEWNTSSGVIQYQKSIFSIMILIILNRFLI